MLGWVGCWLGVAVRELVSVRLGVILGVGWCSRVEIGSASFGVVVGKE